MIELNRKTYYEKMDILPRKILARLLIFVAILKKGMDGGFSICYMDYYMPMHTH